MSTTIYLVRHGQSYSNAGIYSNSQTELETSLTEKGIEQAKARAATLKDIPFVAAYSSDLIRAAQTAEIIARPHDIQVIQSPLLRERRYALPGDEVALRESVRHLNSILDTPSSMTEEEKLAYKNNENMENGNEVVERLMTFFSDIEKKHKNKQVLVVSHGNTMRTLLFYFKYAKHSQIPSGAVENTGYITLQYVNGHLQVRAVSGITMMP